MEAKMNWAYAIGRIALVAMFIYSGAMKLLDIVGTAAQISSKLTIPFFLSDLVGQIEASVGMPIWQILAIALGVIELLAGLLIVFNVLTRTSAVVLLIFTAVATFYLHDFWNMPAGDARTDNMIHAMKNLSIIGAFLILAALPRRVWALEGEAEHMDESSGVVREGEIRP
jgi:uncharacterized membrane protein YphA (DoxX/SURF4 family)